MTLCVLLLLAAVDFSTDRGAEDDDMPTHCPTHRRSYFENSAHHVYQINLLLFMNGIMEFCDQRQPNHVQVELTGDRERSTDADPEHAELNSVRFDTLSGSYVCKELYRATLFRVVDAAISEEYVPAWNCRQYKQQYLGACTHRKSRRHSSLGAFQTQEC